MLALFLAAVPGDALPSPPARPSVALGARTGTGHVSLRSSDTGTASIAITGSDLTTTDRVDRSNRFGPHDHSAGMARNPTARFLRPRWFLPAWKAVLPPEAASAPKARGLTKNAGPNAAAGRMRRPAECSGCFPTGSYPFAAAMLIGAPVGGYLYSAKDEGRSPSRFGTGFALGVVAAVACGAGVNLLDFDLGPNFTETAAFVAAALPGLSVAGRRRIRRKKAPPESAPHASTPTRLAPTPHP